MKNLVIGLFLLGLTSLSFSQNKYSEDKEVQLEDVSVSDVNLNYLAKVQDKKLSNSVVALQNEASVFDVKRSIKFDGRKDSFRVMFQGTIGYIVADYDKNGQILKTSERYKGINLPKHLIIAVLKQYPNSNFLKVAYTVDYDVQKNVEKTYKIQIRNNGKKKNLKINSVDNLNKIVTVALNN